MFWRIKKKQKYEREQRNLSEIKKVVAKTKIGN